MTRHRFIAVVVIVAVVLSGCTASNSLLEEATRTTTTPDLPAECGNAVSLGELSGEAREEFRMSLDEEGLVVSDGENLQIDDELPGIDDAIGPNEACVFFEGSYYYPSLGHVAAGERATLTYEVADGYEPEVATTDRSSR